MKEIPAPYIKANQTGIVSLVILALITQRPAVIVLLWLIELSGLLFGMKGNLFILLAAPFLKGRLTGGKTEAVELTRFNNTLAVLFLTLSVLFFGLGWRASGFVVAGILAGVALIAISGFCLGCVIYYRYKLYRNKRSMKAR